MTATLIFKESGSQYPIDPEGVDNLIKEHTVTRLISNDIQVLAQFNQAEYPFSVLANKYSKTAETLQAAWKRDRTT
jgi:hypothetical protein